MKTSLLILLYLSFHISFYGQKLHFYDDNGILKANNNYQVDSSDFKTVSEIETYLLKEILPTMEYPPISVESCSSGKGLLKLKMTEKEVTLNLIQGIDPWTDKYVMEKVDALKTFIKEKPVAKDIEMYIPYEFSFEFGKKENSLSSLKIIYPGNKARLIDNNIVMFETNFELADVDIMDINNVLSDKTDAYIKKKEKGGMVGIMLVEKDEYKKYLTDIKSSLMKMKNRIYHTKYNASGDKTVLINFSQCNFNYYPWHIIYNIEKKSVESFYTTFVY